GDLRTPAVATGREHVYHLYVIRTEQRDALRKYLTNAGIATVLNYPKALPFYPAYAHYHHTPDDFPVAYSNQSRILSLPIYPEIWMVISGSRVISEWASMFGLHIGGVSLEEGSPVDRLFYMILIFAGFNILRKRKVRLQDLIRQNQWLAAFLIYCLLAVLWSD